MAWWPGLLSLQERGCLTKPTKRMNKGLAGKVLPHKVHDLKSKLNGLVALCYPRKEEEGIDNECH